MYCPFDTRLSCDHCRKCIGPSAHPSSAEIDAALDVIAMAVIDGRYGNGWTRKELLYNDIQRRVTDIVYSGRRA